MICRQALGTAADDEADVDWVQIEWSQTLRRALRLVSSTGKRIDVLLPPGGRLRHGDVLATSEKSRIAVRIHPCDLLALHPADAASAARLALRLGNQHLSAEVDGDTIYTPADGPAEAIADELKVPFSRVLRRFSGRWALGSKVIGMRVNNCTTSGVPAEITNDLPVE